MGEGVPPQFNDWEENRSMIQLLISEPLLLLFIVTAIGSAIGRIRIAGVSLGVAAVLFVGLAFGALHPDIKLPEFVYVLGLVIFVYTVGISSGASFFSALRRKGLRDNLLIVGGITVAFGMTVLVTLLLGLRRGVAAGLFAGSLTNTPALAAALEQIKVLAPPALREQWLADSIVGYSVTYPLGVIGMIVVMIVVQRWWHIDYAQEAQALKLPGHAGTALENRTIRIMQSDSAQSVGELIAQHHWDVVVGRVKHNGTIKLADTETRLVAGDEVSLIGTPATLDAITQALGTASPDALDLDRHALDFRRVIVSERAVIGRPLRDLHLHDQFHAIITRVRRGDVDLLAHDATTLELGDRVRVVAPRAYMERISRFFGDSYRSVSEIDLLTFNVGLALGLLVGLIPIPLPGGVTIKLGFAGGPLLVALILGALGRTGPFVWNMPYSATLMLRQLGLVLFLAGVGTRAGFAFVSTLRQGDGLIILLAGAGITVSTALLVLWVGYHVLKIPMGLLVGMLAGLQTQPALLGFALEQTDNDLPNVGYATVYPLAMITKIMLIQVLLVILP